MNDSLKTKNSLHIEKYLAWMMMDTQELSDHDMDGGDHLFSRDLSQMHQGRSVVGVNNHASTQHYLTCSAKVVWGLWVLGLHKERNKLESGTTC